MLKMRLQQMKLGDRPLAFSDELLNEMMEQIGSPDPELRDDLIYYLFNQGMQLSLITHEQQKKLAEQIIDQRLVLESIDVRKSDTVFTRSFSVLLLALIVHNDATNSFLLAEQFEEIVYLSCDYLVKEADTRGYVVAKGWAHGIAHGADLMATVVSSPRFRKQQLDSVLLSIASPLLRQTEKFADEEAERLSQIISCLLSHFPETEERISSWLRSLTSQLASHPGKKTWRDDYYHLYQKLKQFNQGLYFQLSVHNTQETQQLQQMLLTTIQGYYY